MNIKHRICDKCYIINFRKEYLCIPKVVRPKRINLKFLQMLKKGSKLYSILTGSCPKCHQESMYFEKNPYKLNTLYKMHENCGHCGLHYEIEPSFFYGAMYVSYAVSIAFGVAFFIITHYFLKTSLAASFITIVAGLIALMPVVARLSRNIYINIFVHFDAAWKKRS